MKKYLVTFYAEVEAQDSRMAHTIADKIVDAVSCDQILMSLHNDPVKNCDVQDVELIDEDEDD